MPKSARLFVVSGPSGAGKGTLVGMLRRVRPDLALSVSATTRGPRTGEKDGVHYHFLTDDEFDEHVAAGGFLEWAEVHNNKYGTLRSAVLDELEKGHSVILEIDPQGAYQVRDAYDEAILIFIEPPTLEELERRLRTRATETEMDISKRLLDAREELACIPDYDAVVVNDDVDRSFQELCDVIERYETGEQDLCQ